MGGRQTKSELKTKIILPPTSFPVVASMSRNISTRPRTSLAAFALLTEPRNGRVNLIKPASSRIKEEFFINERTNHKNTMELLPSPSNLKDYNYEQIVDTSSLNTFSLSCCCQEFTEIKNGLFFSLDIIFIICINISLDLEIKKMNNKKYNQTFEEIRTETHCSLIHRCYNINSTYLIFIQL